jgi:hypothetical protein
MSKSKDWLAQNQDQSGATCLSTDLCFGEQHKNPTQHLSLVQSEHHHHLIEK